MFDYNRKTYARFGELVEIECPYSEVCMHMRVAGELMGARLIEGTWSASAQLYREGREFSAPITFSEAGFYLDEGGYYYYPRLKGGYLTPFGSHVAALDEARSFARSCNGPVSVVVEVPQESRLGLPAYRALRTFWSETYEEAVQR